MTILHICSTYLDRPFYECLFENLSLLGINNIIYVPRWSDRQVKKNVFVVSKKFNKLEKLLYWGEQKYILKDIEDRININEIDLVHVHRILYGGYAALQIFKKHKIPFITAIRNSDIYGFGRNIAILRKHSNDIIKSSSKIIFLSRPYLNYTLDNYIYKDYFNYAIDKSEVITNGINQYFIDNSVPKDEHPLPIPNRLIIICVAEINKNKNILTLIKACDLLMAKGYNVELKLLGRIIDKSIFNRISNYKFVKYLGVRSKEEVVYELRNSDIFAMTSIHETFGLVYAEAMTQGLPLIYTRGQGFDGQFQDGEVGYSVDCFDTIEIANKVLDILNDYRNISNRCIEYSKQYSWNRIAHKYKELYDTCLPNTRY